MDNWAPGLKLPWTLDTPFSRLHLHHLCYPYKDKSSFIIFGQTIIIYKWQWQCDTVKTMIWYWFDFSPPALLFQHDQPRRLPQRGEGGSPRGELDFFLLDFSRFWNGFLFLRAGFLSGFLQILKWISISSFWMDFYFFVFSFGWISISIFGCCRLGRTSMRRNGTRWRWTGGTTRSPTGSESSTSISSKCWPRAIISKRG